MIKYIVCFLLCSALAFLPCVRPASANEAQVLEIIVENMNNVGNEDLPQSDNTDNYLSIEERLSIEKAILVLWEHFKNNTLQNAQGANLLDFPKPENVFLAFNGFYFDSGYWVFNGTVKRMITEEDGLEVIDPFNTEYTVKLVRDKEFLFEILYLSFNPVNNFADY